MKPIKSTLPRFAPMLGWVNRLSRKDLSIGSFGASVADLPKKERPLVTYEQGAPPELAEIAVLHAHGPLAGAVQVGDVIAMGRTRFPVTAVGYVANQNLEGLGHLIVKFDGASEPAMPGFVHVTGGDPPEIRVGLRIRILREKAPERRRTTEPCGTWRRCACPATPWVHPGPTAGLELSPCTLSNSPL